MVTAHLRGLAVEVLERHDALAGQVRELAAELATTATWLGADTVAVDEDARGDLTGPLRRELRRPCPR